MKKAADDVQGTKTGIEKLAVELKAYIIMFSKGYVLCDL
jgi:hypothetical protein